MTKAIWYGDPPEKCDTCESPITDEFVDGRTAGGVWACMCKRCHGMFGHGLGTGKGQRYKLTGGKFEKVEG